MKGIWQEITTKVKPGTKIPNWTYLGRGRKETMTVISIKENSIEMSSPNAKMNQNIPQNDFEDVWELWYAYKTGKIKRDNLTSITRFSKYIISLFKWMED